VFFFHYAPVLDLAVFENLVLRGGFIIAEVGITSEPLLDPLARPAIAQTIIRGTRLHIFLSNGLDDVELSVSLYHEVLEGATVAAEAPPRPVTEFN